MLWTMPNTLKGNFRRKAHMQWLFQHSLYMALFSVFMKIIKLVNSFFGTSL